MTDIDFLLSHFSVLEYFPSVPEPAGRMQPLDVKLVDLYNIFFFTMVFLP